MLRRSKRALPLPLVWSEVRVWIALVSILVVAAALRLIWLDRIPLGWHHDEALMGIMAGEVYRGEDRPIFFRQFLGQEPLYIYLSAAMIAVFGGDEGILPLRLTSALVGIATVGVTFLLGRSLFGARIGLLASALLATSFWQVMSSRNAYRSITQPLLEAIAVYLFWQARARGTLRWYILTGIALGGVLYTYLGARAFPGVFVAFALWLLVTRRRPTRHDVARGLALGTAAAAVVAPLAIFFLTNPGTFSPRIEQVFIFRPENSGGNPWPILLDNAWNMLSIFTMSGVPSWRFNIPGRPMFIGLLGVAFCAGVVVIARRLLRRDDAATFVFIWLGVMLFPSVLSLEVGSYTLRAMGLVPAVFFVPALALDWCWAQIVRWRAWARPVATAGLVATVLVDAGLTARDYFVVWAPSFGASLEAGTDAVAQARFLMEAARPSEEEILVGSEYYHHPTIAQLARPVYPHLRWFDGRQSVVFPATSERPLLYVLGFNGMPPEVGELFPRETLVAEEFLPQGVDGSPPPPLLLAYRLTPVQIQAQIDRLLSAPGMRPVVGHVPGLLTPLGAQIDGPVQPGETLRVLLLWRVEGQPPPGEYQMLVHLVDHRLEKVSGVDSLGFPPEEWRPGDVVWSRFAIPVSEMAAPGRYSVQAGMYDRRTGQRLPVANGWPGVNALLLGDVRVTSIDSPRAPSHPIQKRLAEAVELIGVDVTPIEERGTLRVTLHWRADRQIEQDYTVFVQLLDANGRLVTQSDSQPASGALPTTSWLAGEEIVDEHQLMVNEEAPAGRYRLIAGMYLLATGERLPVEGGGDFVELGHVEVP